MQFTRRKIVFISVFSIIFVVFSCVNMYAFGMSYERNLPDVDTDKAFGNMTSMCVPPDTDKSERFEPLPDFRLNRVSNVFEGFRSDKDFSYNIKEYSDKNINIKDGQGFGSFVVMRC